MEDYKKYELTIKVKTNHDPREDLWRIVNKIKDLMPVLSIEHQLIDERPATDEHHGGITDDND